MLVRSKDRTKAFPVSSFSKVKISIAGNGLSVEEMGCGASKSETAAQPTAPIHAVVQPAPASSTQNTKVVEKVKAESDKNNAISKAIESTLTPNVQPQTNETKDTSAIVPTSNSNIDDSKPGVNI